MTKERMAVDSSKEDVKKATDGMGKRSTRWRVDRPKKVEKRKSHRNLVKMLQDLERRSLEQNTIICKITEQKIKRVLLLMYYKRS